MPVCMPPCSSREIDEGEIDDTSHAKTVAPFCLTIPRSEAKNAIVKSRMAV